MGEQVSVTTHPALLKRVLTTEGHALATVPPAAEAAATRPEAGASTVFSSSCSLGSCAKVSPSYSTCVVVQGGSSAAATSSRASGRVASGSSVALAGSKCTVAFAVSLLMTSGGLASQKVPRNGYFVLQSWLVLDVGTPS